MRILLLGISPTSNHSGNRPRTAYLADALRLLGHEVHTVQWRSWREKIDVKTKPGFIQVKLLPSAARMFPGRKPIWNQWLVRYRMEKIVDDLHIDMVIWPNNWYVIGYPPKQFKIPILIDYFDLLSPDMEKSYLPEGRVALCTSKELQIRSSRWTKRAFWIPTPIDLPKFAYSRSEAKRSIGISEDTMLISLIGLTASSELYFIEAIDGMSASNVKCLIVGSGELYEPIKRKVADTAHPERFILVGKVPYEEVPKYFCATDIGMYPGEDSDYYHSACPIKILEYSAAGAAVVSNELRELKHWNLPNVYMTEPNAEGFRRAIEKAAAEKVLHPDLEHFTLARVGHVLQEALQASAL